MGVMLSLRWWRSRVILMLSIYMTETEEKEIEEMLIESVKEEMIEIEETETDRDWRLLEREPRREIEEKESEREEETREMTEEEETLTEIIRRVNMKILRAVMRTWT